MLNKVSRGKDGDQPRAAACRVEAEEECCTPPFCSNFSTENLPTSENTAGSCETAAASAADGEVTKLLRNVITNLISSEHETELASAAEHETGEPLNEKQREVSGSSVPASGQQAVPYVASRIIPRWKRILDISCILLSLPCWLPVMTAIMLWIKMTSPGPIFYRQKRVGYRKHCFMIFKFRTMHVNAETETHKAYFRHLMQLESPMTKLDGSDPRLIRCGRFLRAIGLDELPQLFNVLRGDMTLVGPRPCLPHEFDHYQVWQQQRVNVAPGLTGYWQINGKNKTTFSEMITMDLFYANNMSLWLDVKIILKTIPMLIKQAAELRCLANARSRGAAVNPSAAREV